MISTQFTLDTTGEVVAESDGSANSPNVVSLKAAADTVYLGADEAGATAPLTTSDGWLQIELLSGDFLWAKASATTKVLDVLESRPKTRT